MTKKKKLLREGECNVTQATELLKMPNFRFTDEEIGLWMATQPADKIGRRLQDAS